MEDIQLIIIDLFCGAGGVTLGCQLAKVNGKKVAIVIACVNHDEKAILSHELNHYDVIHFVEDVRTIKIIELKRIVDRYRNIYPNAKLLIHASLECTHFSKAKGGLPRDEDSRTLANGLYMVFNKQTGEYENGQSYIQVLDPDFISIENVKDFMTWGPLDKNGKPIKKDKGIYYKQWKEAIKSLGYDFDYRILNSAYFDAFTSRERYFAQFAKPNLQINWPEPTNTKHGKTVSGIPTKKWRAVKEVLNLKNEGSSIFTRKKPLCDNTCKRLYMGLQKFAHEEMFVTAYYSGGGQIHSINEPCATIPTKDRFSLATCHFIDKQYGTGDCQSINKPAGTLTTNPKLNVVSFNWLMDTSFKNVGSKVSIPAPTILACHKYPYLVSVKWLMDMQFNNIGSSIAKPSPTIIARQDKKPLYLVTANSGKNMIPLNSFDSPYMVKIKEFCNANGIVDLKTRMLEIVELKRIMGFPDNYILIGNMDDQKKYIGNAVEVKTFKAIIEAISLGLIQNQKQKAG